MHCFYIIADSSIHIKQSYSFSKCHKNDINGLFLKIYDKLRNNYSSSSESSSESVSESASSCMISNSFKTVIILSSFALIIFNWSLDGAEVLDSNLLELPFSPSFCLKQSLQKTGLLPVGLNGTWHLFPHLSQVVSNISNLFSNLPESLSLPPPLSPFLLNLPVSLFLPPDRESERFPLSNPPPPDLLFLLKFPITICLN